MERFPDGEKKNGGARCCLMCHCRVPNGCARSVLRPEISHGGVDEATWGMGMDSTSSTQSKHVKVVEMASLGPSWGELGSKKGMGGEPGASAGMDSIISDTAGV
jgi:hypothetical protein